VSKEHVPVARARDWALLWTGGWLSAAPGEMGGERSGGNGVSHSFARFGLQPSINAVRGSSDLIQSSSAHGTLRTLPFGPAGSTDKFFEPRWGRTVHFFLTPPFDHVPGDLSRKSGPVGGSDNTRDIHVYISCGGGQPDSHWLAARGRDGRLLSAPKRAVP
jgi:hypothetical protein